MTGQDSEKKYRRTLLLPQTDFPMKAGLPRLEERLLKQWEEKKTYAQQRALSADREKFILHDGPPYANGDLHMGHALNKILKDIINRSQQMLGKDAHYVPGWDCHGLPIEWKVEESLYENKNENAPHPALLSQSKLRKKCRAFAQKWLDRQRDQFKRLGIWGDWDTPYMTMAPQCEAIIAKEFLKFAMSGALYRALKPVMWSVAEKTSLAEAEIEYHEHVSETIWVGFPCAECPDALKDAHILIWTTTPWTIPGNRAIGFSQSMSYGLYQISAADDEGKKNIIGKKIIIADERAQDVKDAVKIENWQRLSDVNPSGIICDHPFRAKDDRYSFSVPLLAADFITDDTGTGFVHLAPSHGQDDYELCTANKIETPDMLHDDGSYTQEAGFLAGQRILTPTGETGDGQRKTIKALKEHEALFAHGRLRHSYPHSWRSKTPVIFRATPQWFISMEKNDLRKKALKAIDSVKWHPPAARNRLRAMIETRPDWVISRQRAWGVPLTIFVKKKGGQKSEILRDDDVNENIVRIIADEGSDAWFDHPAADFLGKKYNSDEWEKITDIVDVWFESGASHAFVLENNDQLLWPASLYLEGTDQHRGWFQSSLLEACGTRGRAPYREVLTHGFLLNSEGRKMSKSGGSAVAPYEFIQKRGSDILRLWVAINDYENDLRWSEEALATTSDLYRKLRNALRFILGNLHEFSEQEILPFAEMPLLEKYMLHRISDLDEKIRADYQNFNFKQAMQEIVNFVVGDLSSFYFDIRKDALYCDARSSSKRRACRTVLDRLFLFVTKWLSPVLCFTAEEAWQTRYGEETSIHLQTFETPESDWRDQQLMQKWQAIRAVRKTLLAALEIERKEKRIGSSLEAAPKVFISDEKLFQAMAGIDLAEIAITSQIEIISQPIPKDAFCLNDVSHVGIMPGLAQGRRCARSWKILPDVGAISDYPDLSRRDALAAAEYEKSVKK